jgi:hypothetical protein
VTARLSQLFACACCRRIWDRFPDPSNRDLVAAVEDHPDGSFHDPQLQPDLVASSRREHEFRGEAAYWVAKSLGRGFYKTTASASAFIVAARVAFLADVEHSREAEVGRQFALHDAIHFEHVHRPPLPAAVEDEAEIQAALLRDVFGSLPFRPVSVPASLLDWYGGLVVRLARAAYEERSLPSGHLDPARLAVLADALEDAGCDDAVLLAHLRSPGPHVRGCHAIDALLGRE